jgi:phosphoenolpyruvate carboxylase
MGMAPGFRSMAHLSLAKEEKSDFVWEVNPGLVTHIQFVSRYFDSASLRSI